MKFEKSNYDWLFKILDVVFKLFHFKTERKNVSFSIPKRVLIIFPDFIGDAIILTPILRNFRNNFGDSALIDVVCSKNIAQMLVTLPFVNNYFFKDYADKNKRRFLKSRRYDAIFGLNQSPLWGYAALKENVPQRITMNFQRLGIEKTPILNWLATHIVDWTPINDKTAQIEVNFNILRELGLKIHDKRPEINITNKDVVKAGKFLNELKGNNALIHVKAGSYGKLWELKNWVEIVKYLSSDLGYRIFATGAASDKKIYEYLSLKSGVKITNLCGKTSIRETFALHRRINLLLTVDSAPAHIAGLSGVPNIVVIYGPTNNWQWRPYAPNSKIEQVYVDIPCRPCILRNCRDQKCLKEIKTDLVKAAIDRLRS